MNRIPASETSAVHCRVVSKFFGEGDTRVTAVDRVELEVASGELTLLVGPSGCGKTTLISIIAGLLDPSEGSVSLFGTDQGTLPAGRKTTFRRDNVGFVFQQYNLLPALTAAENAAVPLLVAGRPRAAALASAKELLESLGMAGRANALPSQLSGGQQQRVAIARALIHRPRLLVCDEPTAALDAHSGQVTMELLRQVAVEPERAVIVVTHDSRIFGFGDRIVTMTDGRVVRVEAPSAALS